jgi:hypothetical protein
MADRELLELAAKAAGFTPIHWHIYAYEVRDSATGSEFIWNPLKDDGDALRLAVKLKMEVYSGWSEQWEAYAGYSAPNDARIRYCVEPHSDDSFAATRRAIVRAAAEMARAADQEAGGQ